ncbi:MAG: hypothetical protein J0I32_10885 [Sphingobacteriales bacterium]|nr:hypothetical protein [Sphingobacteriales bacterium]OJW01213.1 MAG: hypothetical protein BGO52_07210 [Sphingobacteriales bacterium 44-61]
MKWIIYFSCLLTTIQGLAQDSQDSKRMIFPQETPVSFDLLPDSNWQRFTPSLAEIDSADRYLMTWLSRETPADRNPPALNLYYRQYVGILRNGKRYVYINAACRKPDYFTKNTLYPRGGGNCYFRALIDLKTNEVITLLFNAPR